jgi:hypothetical protein
MVERGDMLAMVGFIVHATAVEAAAAWRLPADAVLSPPVGLRRASLGGFELSARFPPELDARPDWAAAGSHGSLLDARFPIAAGQRGADKQSPQEVLGMAF